MSDLPQNFWIKHVLYFDNVPMRTLDPDNAKDRSLLYELKDRRQPAASVVKEEE
jgi:hypothetical protein